MLVAIGCYLIHNGCLSCNGGDNESTDAIMTYGVNGTDGAQPATSEPIQDAVISAPAVVLQETAPVQPTKYHVIAGSFIYEANADELIVRYRRNFPDLKVEKITTEAWVMVSVWQGATEADGIAAKRKLEQMLDKPGMWVYNLK
jgi:hypothetical protein